MTAGHSARTAVSTAGGHRRPLAGPAMVLAMSSGTDRHEEADHALVDVTVDLGPDAPDDGLGGAGRDAGRSTLTTVELARNARRSIATSC